MSEVMERADTALEVIDVGAHRGVELDRPGVNERGSLLLPTPDQMKTLQLYGEMYVKSGLLPEGIKTWQAVAVTIQHGMDLGLPISTAIQQIYVIKGKPVCSAHLMSALIYRDHGDDALQMVESTELLATYKFKRRSWTEFQTYTYTIEDARRAGLAGDKDGKGAKAGPWQTDPTSMLRARCVANIAHAQFQDSIGGLYLQDELDHLQTKPAVGGQVTPISPEAAAELERSREVIDAEAREVIFWDPLIDEAVNTALPFEDMKAKFLELVNLARRRGDKIGFAALITRAPIHETAENLFVQAEQMGFGEDAAINAAIVYRRRIQLENGAAIEPPPVEADPVTGELPDMPPSDADKSARAEKFRQ